MKLYSWKAKQLINCFASKCIILFEIRLVQLGRFDNFRKVKSEFGFAPIHMTLQHMHFISPILFLTIIITPCMN